MTELKGLEMEANLLARQIEEALPCERGPDCIQSERNRLRKVAPQSVRDGDWFNLVDHALLCPACKAYWFARQAANVLFDLAGDE